MSRLIADPLLTAARFALLLLGGIILFAFVIMIIGIFAVLTVERAEVMTQVISFDAPPSVFWLIVAALVIVSAILATALQFIRLRFRMVVSVDRGDTFIAANAARLAQMGWLIVLGQLGILLIWAVEKVVDGYVDDTGINTDLSLSGWLLALVLFILARVFLRGTDLRAELEGTFGWRLSSNSTMCSTPGG